MLTTKYHIGSLISIFLALGLGILIGGTLGQKWLSHTESHLVDQVMARYEMQIERSQQLEKQISYLQLVNQQLAPVLQNKKVLWIRSKPMDNEWLDFMMESTGLKWEQALWNGEATPQQLAQHWKNKNLDLVILSPPLSKLWSEQRGQAEHNQLNEQYPSSSTMGTEMSSSPKLMFLQPENEVFEKPEQVVQFFQEVKSALEDGSRASVYINSHSSLQ